MKQELSAVARMCQGAARCGQNVLGGRSLRLGCARGPLEVARMCQGGALCGQIVLGAACFGVRLECARWPLAVAGMCQGAARCGQDVLGGRSLWLGCARGPIAVARENTSAINVWENTFGKINRNFKYPHILQRTIPYSKVLMQGKLIAVRVQFSLGGICKQEQMHQCSSSIREGLILIIHIIVSDDQNISLIIFV